VCVCRVSCVVCRVSCVVLTSAGVLIGGDSGKREWKEVENTGCRPLRGLNSTTTTLLNI